MRRLNTADPATIWDDVIYPALTTTERARLTTDMIRRGTFVQHAHVDVGDLQVAAGESADAEPPGTDVTRPSPLLPARDGHLR